MSRADAPFADIGDFGRCRNVLASPATLAHALKRGLVVATTLACSWSLSANLFGGDKGGAPQLTRKPVQTSRFRSSHGREQWVVELSGIEPLASTLRT